MATDQQPGSRSRSPPPVDGPDEDDIIEIGQEGHSDSEAGQDSPGQDDTRQRRQDTSERSRSPAYVTPIPKIDSIPRVSPGIQISAPQDRPELPAFIGTLLVGKPVDGDGDIVDEQTGQVLAHAAGDLPSMVGRRVSNAQGDILGDDGELLGYVADVEWPRARPPAQPRNLFDLMGRASSSLMVDDSGNILDANGNIVGKFHDNNNPLHRKEKEEREARERTRQSREKPGDAGTARQRQRQPSPSPRPSPQQDREQDGEEGQDPDKGREQSQSRSADAEGRPRPRRTEEERRRNAESWRKENPNESPSDIFLDVKSTREGIQLTIRIPTVFNGQQATPHISFS